MCITVVAYMHGPTGWGLHDFNADTVISVLNVAIPLVPEDLRSIFATR
jgi:hypothetical protein